jgi:hypothetical protein
VRRKLAEWAKEVRRLSERGISKLLQLGRLASHQGGADHLSLFLLRRWVGTAPQKSTKEALSCSLVRP